MPRAEDASRIAARLLTTTIPFPFAVLLPSNLAPRIADPNQFDGQPDLNAAYQTAGKMMFLDSDHLWLVGNIPPLHQFSRIYSQVLQRPASTLKSCHYSRPTPHPTTIHPNLPSTLEDWKHAQDNDLNLDCRPTFSVYCTTVLPSCNTVRFKI